MTTSTKQPTRKATVTRTGEREIRIERIFDAPREKVWRAFTDPTLVARWWGRGNKLVIERDEVKKGGHWRYVEHHEGVADGFEGRYAEVTPPVRVVRTFEWDGMPGHVIVEHMTMEPLGGGRTKISITMQFHTPMERDGFAQSGVEGGVNQSYAALDRVLAQLD